MDNIHLSNNIVNYIDEDETYIIKTNLCKRLSKELNLPEIVYHDTGEYDKPTEHGLSNCNVIIPKYYKLHKNPSKIFDIDYYEIIKDDIRNCRVLNKYQLDYIKNLTDESKNELFDIFNDCLKLLNDIVNNPL